MVNFFKVLKLYIYNYNYKAIYNSNCFKITYNSLIINIIKIYLTNSYDEKSFINFITNIKILYFIEYFFVNNLIFIFFHMITKSSYQIFNWNFQKQNNTSQNKKTKKIQIILFYWIIYTDYGWCISLIFFNYIILK